MKAIVKLVIVGMLLFSCKKNETLSKQLIAVDGVIEDGNYPIVYLTGTTDYASVIDSSVYFNVILTHAKITVRTDNDSEVLILRKDINHFPFHYYIGNRLKGVIGKTYSLEVILNGDTLTAQTSIPQKAEAQNIRFERDATDTTKGFIWLGINDPKDIHNYYRSFTNVFNKQKKFVATHLSVLDDETFNGRYVEFPLYQGYNPNSKDKVDYRFSAGDTIDVKLCSIDAESYLFWSGFEREMFNAGNPFGAEGRNLVSNIKGGIGVWTGYSVSKYRVIAK